MALDRQKILSELGSVVNQLQSAECGCMGKLFSPSGQENYNPGHVAGHHGGGFNMHNYYHGQNQGYNAPSAGEPCVGGRQGFCYPQKLFSDTYSYLNSNMMQPAIQEVYQDLKSITPQNTIMNNPLGGQMGLSANNPNLGHGGQNSMPHATLGNPNMNIAHANSPQGNFGNAAMNNQNSQGMGQMGQGMEQTGYGHMGHMGHGMGPTREVIAEDQGMRQMGQERGMGQMGQEMGQMGQGMGQMAQGIDQMGQGMGQIGQGMGQMGQGMGHMGQGIGQMGQGMGHMGQETGQINPASDRSGGMGGMGQQIMKMMTASHGRPNKMSNLGNLPINTPVHMPQSGDTGHLAGVDNQGQYNSGQMQSNTGYMQMGNMHQGRPEMQTAQYMSQQNTFPGEAENAQSNQMHGNMNQMVSGPTPTGNINAANLGNRAAYGEHSAGMAKFNEMFPGVVNGNLGFDPMAIAIQMNPANQQKAAMDTMEKLMMNNSQGLSKIMDPNGNASAHMQPVINAVNAVSSSINQPNQPRIEETVQRIPETQLDNNQMQQPIHSQQQNDQIPQRLYQPPPQQQMVDPNTGAAVINAPLPTVYEGSEDPYAKEPLASYTSAPTAPDTYKDPLLPADTSRNLLHSHHFQHLTKPHKNYEYNTIGQPVERHYHNPNNSTRYNNVRETISKTALVGNRAIGRIPSRTQQQVLYNQYKGSQSFTQQNIKPPARNNASHSEPRIALPQYALQAPIEKHGGDSAANDQVSPLNVKFPNLSSKQAAEKNVKQRNGLQDQVFSAFPSSAKWSFHGNNTAPPYSVGYRFRSK